jgi:hypothetical protein
MKFINNISQVFICLLYTVDTVVPKTIKKTKSVDEKHISLWPTVDRPLNTPHRAAAEPVGAARPPARSPPAARAQQPITSFFKKKNFFERAFSNESLRRRPRSWQLSGWRTGSFLRCKEVEEVGDEIWTGT